MYIRVCISFLQEQFHFIICMLKVLNFAISSSFTLGFSVIRSDTLLTQRYTQFYSISQVICVTCNKTLEYLAVNIIFGSLYLRDLCFVWLICSTCCSRFSLGLFVFLKKTMKRFFSAISGRIVSYCAESSSKIWEVFLHIRGGSEKLLILFSLLYLFLAVKDNASK